MDLTEDIDPEEAAGDARGEFTGKNLTTSGDRSAYHS